MGKKELFPTLSLDEKRKLLDLTEWYLQSVLSARKGGEAKLVNVGVEADFVEKLSDDEIREAIELSRLTQKASTADNPKEALRLFKQIVDRVPFDSISMLSIGVCYANLGQGRKAVSYVEKALESDPDNERIRQNLEAIRQHFGL